MTINALIILANGFEELEAVAVIDVLRRAGINLLIAGVEQKQVVSSRKLKVEADVLLAEVLDQLFEIVILPGGEPGTTNLENSSQVREILMHHYQQDRWLAAICAAPRILAELGFLKGKKATSFPGTSSKMQGSKYAEDAVVVDGHIITSRGAGTSLAFAYQILVSLGMPETAERLKTAMVFNG